MGNTSSQRSKSTKGGDEENKKGEEGENTRVCSLFEDKKKASRLLTKRGSAGLAIVVSKEVVQNTPKAFIRKTSRQNITT